MRNKNIFLVQLLICFGYICSGCASIDNKNINSYDHNDIDLSVIEGPFTGSKDKKFFKTDIIDDSINNESNTKKFNEELKAILNKDRQSNIYKEKIISFSIDDPYLYDAVDFFKEELECNIYIEPSLRMIKSRSVTAKDITVVEALLLFSRINDLVVSKNDDISILTKNSIIEKSDILYITTYPDLQRMQQKIKNAIDASKQILLGKKEIEIAEINLKKEQNSIQGDPFSYRFKYADPFEVKEYLTQLYINTDQRQKNIKSSSSSNRYANSGKENQYNNVSFSLYEPENMITVSAPASLKSEIMARLEEIDVKPRQVYIEARIVEIERSRIKDLGISYGGHYIQGFNRKFPNLIVTKGAGGSSYNNDLINLPAETDTRGANIGIDIGSVTGNLQLYAKLSALEKEGYSRILSNPKVIAINGSKAVIKSGKEIPYKSSSSNLGTSVQFKEATISLAVTPFIMKDNRVRMKIVASKDEIDPIVSIDGVPAIKKKEIVTNVMVDDGGSAALGGMFESVGANNQNKVPLISKIPLLGRLFRSDHNEDKRLELLIFITPTIVRN